MASELITVPKANMRKIVLKRNVGNIIRFAVADADGHINPKMIIQILADFGVGPQGEKIHKVEMEGKREAYVDDAGLALLLPTAP